MKAAPFAYARPNTLDAALELLTQNEDAKVLAGGQSLLPVMALRLGAPTLIVDIGGLGASEGLDRIRIAADGSVTIGALVRHADVEDSSEVARRAPLLHEAASLIGHRAIRNRGTAVGSIAHGDPNAEFPAVCLATNATMVAASVRGRREIAASEFYLGFLQTALAPDEVLVEVRFPPQRPGTTGSVVEVARRHGDYALVGVITRMVVTNGIVVEAALALLSVAPTPVRIPAAEDLLTGKSPTLHVFGEVASAVSAGIDPPADTHATSKYRKHLAAVLTRRGLAVAIERLETE